MERLSDGRILGSVLGIYFFLLFFYNFFGRRVLLFYFMGMGWLRNLFKVRL